MSVRVFLESMGALPPTAKPATTEPPTSLGDFFGGMLGEGEPEPNPDPTVDTAVHQPTQPVEPMTLKTINTALDKVANFEGGYVNDPVDRGGETNHGVTLKFLRSVQPDAGSAELKRLTKEDARRLFFTHFVDKPGINKLPDVALAEAVSLSINAGPKAAIRVLQRAAGVPADGVIGPVTIKAVEALTNDQIKVAVDNFYHSIVKSNPSQGRFLKGWLNRSAVISSIPEDTPNV